MTGPHYEITTGQPVGSSPSPYPPTGPPPRRKKPKAAIVASAVALVVGAGASTAVLLPLYAKASANAEYYENARDHASAKTITETETIVETEIKTHTETVTVEPPPPPEPEGPSTTFGDGIWMVGQDIAPGTYKATGSSCYWARLSGLSGEFGDIIANGIGSGGQVVVTIAASDVAFESSSCGEWAPMG